MKIIEVIKQLQLVQKNLDLMKDEIGGVKAGDHDKQSLALASTIDVLQKIHDMNTLAYIVVTVDMDVDLGPSIVDIIEVADNEEKAQEAVQLINDGKYPGMEVFGEGWTEANYIIKTVGSDVARSVWLKHKQEEDAEFDEN